MWRAASNAALPFISGGFTHPFDIFKIDVESDTRDLGHVDVAVLIQFVGSATEIFRFFLIVDEGVEQAALVPADVTRNSADGECRRTGVVECRSCVCSL